jgi:hypothetical protein
MRGTERPVKGIRRQHPLFFWGSVVVALLLLGATAVVGSRIPQYRAEAAELEQSLSESERDARDRILNSQARRSELAVALMQRQLRLRALEQKGVHLAISLEDSTLYLRHGPATLRQAKVLVGPDSAVVAPDGQKWRLIQALGERHLAEKQVSPVYTIPDWVYVSRGERIPAESERRVEGGLGRYVLRLDDGTEIHTRPRRGPFAEGVRPGGFIVENERDMAAIFEALRVDTPVFIY